MELLKGGADLEQESALERAIEYIEAHLFEEISLRDVSREIGYSYCHMTRLFSAVLGEPVGRYINRRRLYNASKRLIHTNQRVIDIAFDCGFASSEAFSRAFKAAFGSSPMNYRKTGLDLVVNAKRKLSPHDVRHIAGNISHTPEIVILEETRLVGLRGTTSIFDNRLPALWEQFLRHHSGLFAETGVGYGICETQRTAYTEDGDVSFSVVVGSAVKSFDYVSQALVRKTIAGGRYASFTHRGAFANLFVTYQYIFGTWLPATKEVLDDREDLEIYDRKVFTVDDPNNEVTILIPIK